MDIKKLRIEEFAEALSSKSPTPGGGGASALVAALGAALGGMVVSLTVGKPKYAEVEVKMVRYGEQVQRLQTELLDLIQEDAEAFEPLSKAYGLPAGSDDEAAKKQRIMEEALKNAAGPPFKIMQKCCEVIGILESLASDGNKLVVSDAGTGALFCKAALYGAGLNVLINTAMMKDRKYAESLECEMHSMFDEYSAKTDVVYAHTINVISGYKKTGE